MLYLSYLSKVQLNINTWFIFIMKSKISDIAKPYWSVGIFSETTCIIGEKITKWKISDMSHVLQKTSFLKLCLIQWITAAFWFRFVCEMNLVDTKPWYHYSLSLINHSNLLWRNDLVLFSHSPIIQSLPLISTFLLVFTIMHFL